MTQKRHLLATRLLLSLLAVLTASTAWADDVNMPATGMSTLTLDGTVTTFKVYDDGGKDGNYSNNCDGYLTLTAPAGYVLQLSGSITSESSDKLTVYDGTETSGTKLLDAVSGTFGGTKTTITPVVSTGQSMMLHFYSDDGFNYAGLDLTVTLISTSTEYDITLNTVAGGSIAATVGGTSTTTARMSEVVTLTATASDGYLLCGLSVTDANSNVVAVTDMLWYTGANTATFSMPASAVSVTPTFTNDLSQTSLSINMPKTDTKTATIPSGVTSFKVYDDGGASGYYSDLCSGYLSLSAPDGYALQLSGSIKTENGYDMLTVYDGSTTSATELLAAVSSTSSGTQTAITTVVSSGQSMMLYFHSDGSGYFAGLDLTVTLVKRIELADAADNTDAINGWQDGLANVTLSARTLYKDGAWNTLCLPFDVTLSGSPLDGATLMELDVEGTYDTDKRTGFDTESGTLSLYFKEATGITAGTPYIIKWDSGADIVSPVFEGVTINIIAASTVQTTDGKVQFIGTYGPTDIFSTDKDNLFLGADNNLYWPEGEGMTSYTVNAFRAYFHVGDGSTPAPVQRTVISFGDGTTAIHEVFMDNGEWTMDNEAGAWYDLSGRRVADSRLSDGSLKPGIYIRNGRKVIVK